MTLHPKSSLTENFTMDFKQSEFYASALFLQTWGLYLQRWLWTTEQFLFSFVQVRNIWCYLWFRDSLTLGAWYFNPFPGPILAWSLMMHWLQPQSTPCEAPPSSWIGFDWQYTQGCFHLYCLCTFLLSSFSLPFNFPWICFDTALWKQPALSAIMFYGLPYKRRVSMSVFWNTLESAVFPMIVFIST